MGESSLLKIISEKWIKPSSPTSPSSRYYKFSAMDVYVGDSLTPVAFFYPSASIHGGKSSRLELVELLETSLSKTLTYYYPFAGRFMEDNITVDCNDAGVQVWEVEVQASMSEILDKRGQGYHPWNAVFIQGMYRCVLSHVMVQFSYFECGGICVGISMSHKLGDAISLANFMIDWVSVARASSSSSSEDVPPPSPVLSGASIFPPPNHPIVMPMSEGTTTTHLVTQRFVFSPSNISELKKKVTTETGIKNPTQTEVVTALIFKAAMSSAAKLNSGSFKPSSLVQVANFRPLTIPPLQEKLVGNFVNRFILIVKEETERTLSRIVTEMRKSKVEYVEAHRARLEGNEFLDKLSRFYEEDEKKLKGNDFDKYTFTSCFRFPFYEADFGFGKPVFVCQAGGLIGQTTVMLGTPKGDEIDAFVTLKPDQMSIFEQDDELLAYASLNPTIVSVQN